MASIKAKKGNPFERLIAYNLQINGYLVERIDDNTAGVDLVARKADETYYVECKHHKGFSWNELKKYYVKTEKRAIEDMTIPLLVFRGNNQPILVMHETGDVHVVEEWSSFFGKRIITIPKGFKVWKGT